MIEGDPLFADAQGLDFQLIPSAPCFPSCPVNVAFTK
jgi:hypothetical protein